MLVDAHLLLLSLLLASAKCASDSDGLTVKGNAQQNSIKSKNMNDDGEVQANSTRRFVPVGVHLLMPQIDSFMHYTMRRSLEPNKDELPFDLGYLYNSECEDCALSFYFDGVDKSVECESMRQGVIADDTTQINLASNYYDMCNHLRDAAMNYRDSTQWCNLFPMKQKRINTITKAAKFNTLCDKYDSLQLKATAAVGWYRREPDFQMALGNKDCIYHTDCEPGVQVTERHKTGAQTVKQKLMAAVAGIAATEKRIGFYHCSSGLCRAC